MPGCRSRAAPDRLKLVHLLAHGERNVTQITEALNILPLNITHHLTALKHANLIRGEKRGRFVVHSLGPQVLEEVIATGVPKAALNFGCCQLLPQAK